MRAGIDNDLVQIEIDDQDRKLSVCRPILIHHSGAVHTTTGPAGLMPRLFFATSHRS